MKYQNIKTGEIRDFHCTINGETWKPMETKASISVDEKPEKKPVKKTEKK